MTTIESESAATAVAPEQSAQLLDGASNEMALQAARHAKVCNELGKMAPAGEVVVEYDVVGWQGVCSPVQGIIVAITERRSSSVAEQDDTQNERFTRVLHPSRARENIVDTKLFDDLNKKAQAWRAAHKRGDGYTLPL